MRNKPTERMVLIKEKVEERKEREQKKFKNRAVEAKENAKEAFGCMLLVIIASLFIYGLQEVGFFDNLSSEPASMYRDGDPYLHGDAF